MAATTTSPPPAPPSLIDPEHDELILVRVLARERTGKLIGPSTQWRWIRHGCRGVRLEAVQIAGRWYSTRAAWAAFVAGQTAAALGADATTQPSARSAEKAEKLRAAGLLAK